MFLTPSSEDRFQDKPGLFYLTVISQNLLLSRHCSNPPSVSKLEVRGMGNKRERKEYVCNSMDREHIDSCGILNPD
jgi:hypothetical protein